MSQNMMINSQASWPAKVFALALGIMPTLSLWAPLGMTPIFIITAIACLVLTWGQKPWRAVPTMVIVILCLLVVWAALTSFWAVDPLRSLRSAAVLALTNFAGLVVVGTSLGFGAADRKVVGLGALAGLSLCLVIGLVEITIWEGGLTVILRGLPSDWTSLAIAGMNRGMTVVSLLVFSVAWWLMRQGRRVAGLSLVAIAGALVMQSETLAGKLAFAGGVVVLILTAVDFPRLGRTLGGCLVVAVVVAPVAASLLPPPHVTAGWGIPYSAHHRLTIWDFAAQKIAERPLGGWGMDASRNMPGGNDVVLVDFSNVGSGVSPEQLMPLHPHNAILQWWLELGAVGTALFAGLIWWLGGMAGRFKAAPLLWTGMVISAVSYGFWQSWWQSSLWLAVALACALTRDHEPKPA